MDFDGWVKPQRVYMYIYGRKLGNLNVMFERGYGKNLLWYVFMYEDQKGARVILGFTRSYIYNVSPKSKRIMYFLYQLWITFFYLYIIWCTLSY